MHTGQSGIFALGTGSHSCYFVPSVQVLRGFALG